MKSAQNINQSRKPWWAMAAITSMAVWMAACSFDKEEERFPVIPTCDSVAVSFNAEILPIVQNQCLSCHSLSSAVGNVVIEQYSDFAPYTTSGRLVRAVEYNGSSPMPPSGKLSDCDISKFRNWVADGAPNN